MFTNKIIVATMIPVFNEETKAQRVHKITGEPIFNVKLVLESNLFPNKVFPEDADLALLYPNRQTFEVPFNYMRSSMANMGKQFDPINVFDLAGCSIMYNVWSTPADTTKENPFKKMVRGKEVSYTLPRHRAAGFVLIPNRALIDAMGAAAPVVLAKTVLVPTKIAGDTKHGESFEDDANKGDKTEEQIAKEKLDQAAADKAAEDAKQVEPAKAKK